MSQPMLPQDQREPLARIAETLARLQDALERLAPSRVPAPDWSQAPAYVWHGSAAHAVPAIEAPPLDLLRGIDAQKAVVAGNVARLAAGHAAHDMLLWGSRGMGKSALIRSSVVAAQQDGGRIALVQVAQEALAGLSALFAALGQVDRRFLVYIDDLGFEEGDSNGPRLLRR